MKRTLAHKQANELHAHRIQHLEPDIATISAEEGLARLNSCRDGLSSGEAAARLLRHGKNSISVFKPIPLLRLFRENFLHTMAILLWSAGIVAFVAQMPELGVAICLVNIINGTFSFWQEYQAEKATEALKKLLPEAVLSRRDGKPSLISTLDLVPGDIILLSEGDKIPADARVISAEGLRVDQSTLSGESSARKKNSLQFEKPPSLNGTVGRSREDVPNLLFAGTSVLTGHAEALVYATGTLTEFGRIAHLTQTISEQESPLQKEMKRVTRAVTVLALGVGAILFTLATLITDTNPAQAFIFAMGMVVAFVPEGMVPTVTLALAMAVQRMAGRHALVKRLSSVEALGCTNVICTDKTGTLTKNEMTVKRAMAGLLDFSFSGSGYDDTGEISGPEPGAKHWSDLTELLKTAALCNNASFERSASGIRHTGDPTELALLVAARKGAIVKEDEESRQPRLHEAPFDSYRKCMSTVHQCGSNRILHLKGSPAMVLERCKYLLVNGSERLIETEERQELKVKIDFYAKQSFRVIALARKQLAADVDVNLGQALETNLCFLGLLALHDPPRPEVPEAVRKCHEAGIQLVMITGDYELTAEAIARDVGILHSDKARVVSGMQLDRLTDQELMEILNSEVIFARVNPEHKLRVVNAFQRCGKVVAVTGDGVNDAPALKKADIGVAMGIAGTDVAKEAADMILLDDNFASIVGAVEEGRKVYENIKKFAVYVFNSNMAEAVPFAVMLFSCGLIPMPLTIMQVLAIDLGTDMVPAIGLGADRTHENVMQKPPRSLHCPLLSASLLCRALLWYGAIEAIAGMGGYFFSNSLHGWPGSALAPMGSENWRAATSMTMSCIVAGQIGTVFCCRTEERSLFTINPFDNRLIIAGVIVEIILLAAMIYFPPLQRIFNTAPLGIVELCFAFAWAPIIVLLDELRKLINRKFRAKHSG